MDLSPETIANTAATALDTAVLGPLLIASAFASCLLISVWAATRGNDKDSRDRALKIAELLIRLFHRRR